MPKSVMQSIVDELQKERTRLQGELHRVTAALTAFGKVYLKGGRPRTTARRKRTLSAAGRKRIVAAQRARWARFRSAQQKESASRTSARGARKKH